MSTTRRLGTLGAVASAVAAALSATPAGAQGASSVLDEITVTARKRDESLLEVPLTVTAFSEEDIARIGIRSLEDISDFAPGLFYSTMGSQRGGRSESVVRFRGMDINDVTPVRQLASVFVDGVYVSGGLSSISMEDVARVEVIKGPQSAYFGRSTFGGAVNFVTRRPAERLEGQVNVTAAEDGEYDVSASVDVPLVDDRLAARLTARYYTTDGRWRSATDGGRLGEEETRSLALTVNARPTDALELTFRGFISEDEDGLPPTFALDGSFHNCGPFFEGGRTYICGTLPRVRDIEINTVLDGEPRDIYLNNSRNSEALERGPGLSGMGLRRKMRRVSLSGDWDIADTGMVLAGAASYNRLEQRRLMDLDYTGAQVWLEGNFQDISDTGLELRLSGGGDRFDWLVGVSRFALDFDTTSGASIGYLYPNPVFVNGFFLDQAVVTDEVTTNAVFGAVSYDLTDTVNLSVETRYQRDRIDQGQVADTAVRETFTNFLPRVILQWQPTADTNLYATFAKGNKPGNFNISLLSLTAEQREEVRQQTGAVEFVDEEELKNFELGLKQRLFDGRLFVGVAAYYMEWTNQQTRTTAVITDPNTPAGFRTTPVIVTAGKTDLWGVELESTFQVTDRLFLRGAFNWAASEYKDFECGFCERVTGTVDVRGNETPRFPKYSGSLGAEWIDQVNAELDYFLRADVIYTGSAWDEAFNLAKTSDYTLVNARAGLQADRWRAEVFVTNLFNDRNYRSAARFTDFTTGTFNLSDFVTNVTPADPRKLGVRLSYRF